MFVMLHAFLFIVVLGGNIHIVEVLSKLMEIFMFKYQAQFTTSALHQLMSNSTLYSSEDHPNATPVITLEILSRPDGSQTYRETDPSSTTLLLDSTSGMHFLTDDQACSLFSPKLEPTHTDGEDNDEVPEYPMRSKQGLLEYMVRRDGSAVCKLCGEILQSRTHWYRHKYKFHVTPIPPAPTIFKCEHCGMFFKSRKGYNGHIASWHQKVEAIPQEIAPPPLEKPIIKQEPLDTELPITSCELPSLHYAGPTVTSAPLKRGPKPKDPLENSGPEWERQRLHEERLVADIIARVRRECEAAGIDGSAAGARRGYSRRSALTNG